MLQNYKNLIQELFDNVFHNGNTNISFGQYISIIGMSLLLMLALVLFVGMVVGMFYLPYLGYKKFLLKETNLENEKVLSLDNKTKKEKKEIKKQISEIEKRKIKKTFVYVLILVTVYLPIVIPTVLYIFTTLKNIL